MATSQVIKKENEIMEKRLDINSPLETIQESPRPVRLRPVIVPSVLTSEVHEEKQTCVASSKTATRHGTSSSKLYLIALILYHLIQWIKIQETVGVSKVQDEEDLD